MILARRSFILGAAASLLAAPAIVRAGSLMPVRALLETPAPLYLGPYPWKLIYAGVYFTAQELMDAGLVPVAQNLARNAPPVVVI